MYKLKYNFNQYNDVISTYINVLIDKSTISFQQQIRNGQIKNSKKDADSLAGCIQNVEEYLHYNYEKSPESFNHIINATIKNVKTISVLPYNKRRIYGETQEQNKTIFINPDLPNSKYLTGEERTRLYMAHELGHIINHEWMNKVEDYANQQIRQGRLSQEHAQLIYDGFSMLDEATTQNRAENFVYEFSGKQRPRLANYRNGNLFNGETYKSNFDFYSELQEPATMFARTLRGIGKENDDLTALDMLSERALLPNFFTNILNEYVKDGQMPAFIQEVQYMGLLKRASYANFGYENVSYIYNSKTYLEKFKGVTEQMRDYREPLLNYRASLDDGYDDR